MRVGGKGADVTQRKERMLFIAHLCTPTILLLLGIQTLSSQHSEIRLLVLGVVCLQLGIGLRYEPRRVAWLIPLVPGALLNLIACAANSWRLQMPVSRAALAYAAPGARVDGGHCLMTAATRLRFLCDIYPVHAIGGVMSLGDALIGAALVGLVLVKIGKGVRFVLGWSESV